MAIYSSGTAAESSIPSSLEKSNDEVDNKKSPSKGKRAINSNDQSGKLTDVSKANAIKRKNFEKVSPTEASMQSPPSSQRMRADKRRQAKNVQVSSSDSEVDEQNKPTPRILNTQSGSTRTTRNSSKNNDSVSSRSPETSAKGSLEKLPELERKHKLRKRQKIYSDEEGTEVLPGTTKQCLTRRNAVVTCTHYKNVAFRCDDLSEDQLSTI